MFLGPPVLSLLSLRKKLGNCCQTNHSYSWHSYRDHGLNGVPVLLSNSQARPGRNFSQPRARLLAHLCINKCHLGFQCIFLEKIDVNCGKRARSYAISTSQSKNGAVLGQSYLLGPFQEFPSLHEVLVDHHLRRERCRHRGCRCHLRHSAALLSAPLLISLF